MTHVGRLLDTVAGARFVHKVWRLIDGGVHEHVRIRIIGTICHLLLVNGYHTHAITQLVINVISLLTIYHRALLMAKHYPSHFHRQ